MLIRSASAICRSTLRRRSARGSFNPQLIFRQPLRDCFSLLLTQHWTFGLVTAGKNVPSKQCFSESGLMEKFVSSQPLDSTTGPVIPKYLCPSIEATSNTTNGERNANLAVPKAELADKTEDWSSRLQRHPKPLGPLKRLSLVGPETSSII